MFTGYAAQCIAMPFDKHRHIQCASVTVFFLGVTATYSMTLSCTRSVPYPVVMPVFLETSSQGVHRLGVRGKSADFLMLSSPRKSMTTLSRPMPAPPCGHMPNLNDSM